MSVTTHTNVGSQGVLQALADYDLHHSGSVEVPAAPAPANAQVQSVGESSNPSWWSTDHRRIPPYRPINYDLDQESRPAGSNFIESVFIATMLNGVRLNANINTLWRVTGGRMNNRIFHYKIGGEW